MKDGYVVTYGDTMDHSKGDFWRLEIYTTYNDAIDSAKEAMTHLSDGQLKNWVKTRQFSASYVINAWINGPTILWVEKLRVIPAGRKCIE